MSSAATPPRIGIGRALAFVAVSFAASTAFYGIYSAFLPISMPPAFIACGVLCAVLSHLFGFWGYRSNVWLKAGAIAVCLVMPYVALIAQILAVCYTGPECM